MDHVTLSRLLWPRPRSVVSMDGRWPVPELVVVEEEGLGPVIEALRREGFSVASGPRDGLESLHVETRTEPEIGGITASRLDLGPEGIRLIGASSAGLRSGLVTLAQILRVARSAGVTTLPAMHIEDEAEIPTRGVLLDVSRDRVPRTSSLDRLTDRWATWKLDHAQLYFEHTFAYRGHEDVWRDASPFTPDEVRRLDHRAAALGLELAPCQNSFGHFHRWLRLPRYRDLAEVPEGLPHPWSDEPEPFSLCPTDPRALELLEDLYEQLLPCFSSPIVNVGGDETFDLGLGRSAERCAQGSGEVWLEFIANVRELASRHGRRIAIWGDVPLASPDLVERLPADVLALLWGYEAGHPFAEESARLAAAGREHWVVPGTSAWNSFAGRWSNAVANLEEAARAAVTSSATGYLIAEWGDHGHLQPPSIAEPAWFAGAGLAWRAVDRQDVDWHRLLDLHVYRDPAGGLSRAALALGDAWRATGADPRNGTVLFRLLVDFASDLEHPRYGGMTAKGLERVEEIVDEARADLRGARSQRDDAALLVRELEWVGEALRLGARLGRVRLAAGARVPVGELPRSDRHELARSVGDLVDGHRELWRERSRPGGLDDSAERLLRLRRALLGE